MKRKKRIFWSIILRYLPVGRRTIADIIRKYKLYGSVGENCYIPGSALPLYSELIFLHNNIVLGTDVRFVTHDAIHLMLNCKFGSGEFMEKVGCIEIMDNVFIGSGTRIMNNVRIGENVIIGSDSLITKDIPNNSVYAGNPAKFICYCDDFIETRVDYTDTVKSLYGISKISEIDDNFAAKMYNNFVKEKEYKHNH